MIKVVLAAFSCKGYYCFTIIKGLNSVWILFYLCLLRRVKGLKGKKAWGTISASSISSVRSPSPTPSPSLSPTLLSPKRNLYDIEMATSSNLDSKQKMTEESNLDVKNTELRRWMVHYILLVLLLHNVILLRSTPELPKLSASTPEYSSPFSREKRRVNSSSFLSIAPHSSGNSRYSTIISTLRYNCDSIIMYEPLAKFYTW